MVRVCSSHTGFSPLTIRALMHSIASTCLTHHGNLVITACSNRVIKEGDDGAEPFHNQAAKHRLGRLSSWKRCTWYRDLLPLPTDPPLADGTGAGPVSGAEKPARHCTSHTALLELGELRDVWAPSTATRGCWDNPVQPPGCVLTAAIPRPKGARTPGPAASPLRSHFPRGLGHGL